MIRKSVIAFTIALAMAGIASANTFDASVVMNKAAFETTKAHLIAQLGTDRYSEIGASEKANVIAALDRISGQLAKAPEQMTDQDRIDIYNDQELINEIATHAVTNSRIFCEREAPTGSHVIHVTCLTMATWMEREKSGQTSLHSVGGGASKCTASSMGREAPGCGDT